MLVIALQSFLGEPYSMATNEIRDIPDGPILDGLIAAGYVEEYTGQGTGGGTGTVGPQGPKGDKGDKGDPGDKGDKGDKGDTGATGPKGATGAAGQGVPTGGTEGQVLAKKDGTNYNAKWIDLPGSDIYEPKITSKGTAFNKDFGTIAGTVAEGNTVVEDTKGVALYCQSADKTVMQTKIQEVVNTMPDTSSKVIYISSNVNTLFAGYAMRGFLYRATSKYWTCLLDTYANNKKVPLMRLSRDSDTYAWDEYATNSGTIDISANLLNGWTPSGAFYISRTGNLVKIVGYINAGTKTKDTVILNVPGEFRPTAATTIIGGVYNANIFNTNQPLKVSTNGDISIRFTDIPSTSNVLLINDVYIL